MQDGESASGRFKATILICLLSTKRALSVMPISVKEHSLSSAEARNFEVTICQIREGHHVYYRASAPNAGRGALAYGHSPEAALAKLYDEAIPSVIERPDSPSLSLGSAMHLGQRDQLR